MVRKPEALPVKAAPYLLAALLLATGPERSFAYRPFDSTDADVVAEGEFELELGPLGRLREGDKRVRIAPAIVANFGLQGDRELVIQGQRETALDRSAGEPRTSFTDTGAFIKQVLRPGALQDKPGLSVATEYGILLPSSPSGETRTGASVAGIISGRGGAGTIHLNGALAYTREHKLDRFLGVIVEGPYDWPIRPVAEFFSEQSSGEPLLHSRLAGAIWNVREHLSLDLGVRTAYSPGAAVHERRLGLTWSFPFKEL
jgi:hypothetical protein